MFRIIVNVVCLLTGGVVLGLLIRDYRSGDFGSGPAADDVVYSNDGAAFSGEADEAMPDPTEIENATPAKPPEDEAWLSRFELTERSGETVSSEDLLGKPYVVSFFFSTCPSICKTQNRKLKELQDEFEGRGVRFLAISVDPETDTPEVLREYAARFGADADQWLFLTGDLTYIRRIGAEVFREPVAKQFHTERFTLVDAEGEIEGFYSWPERRQFAALKDKIRELIDAPEASS